MVLDDFNSNTIEKTAQSIEYGTVNGPWRLWDSRRSSEAAPRIYDPLTVSDRKGGPAHPPRSTHTHLEAYRERRTIKKRPRVSYVEKEFLITVLSSEHTLSITQSVPTASIMRLRL